MVAMSVWPTDGADGSVASEARWRKMGRLWAPSAVIAGAGGELAPSLAMPNLTVQSGAAWVDGHYAELASSQVLTATANGLAVVRFDPSANTAELLWRDGVSTPAQSPTGTWELPIASTSGSVLTDRRSPIYRPQQSDLLYNAPPMGGSVATTPGLVGVLVVPNLPFPYRALILLNYFLNPGPGVNSAFMAVRVNHTGGTSVVTDTLVRLARTTGVITTGSPTVVYERAAGGPLTVGCWLHTDGPSVGVSPGVAESQLQVLVSPI